MNEANNPILDRAVQKLMINLEELTKLYRSMLDLVRKEKELLVEADLIKLQGNNDAKESLISRIRALDALRTRYAEEIAIMVKGDDKNPRLLEIAQKVGGPNGDRLRLQHATLDLLVKRLNEFNKENQEYAESALKTVQGAMTNIKETLSGKKTYERKGAMKMGPESAGNFVSKEA